MFSNWSESSMSFATVTPALVMRGAPYDLSSTTLRPFGPNVTRTASARISMPRSIRSRASLLSRMSFAAILVFPSSWRLVGDDAHDVGFLHDDEVLTIDLDLVCRLLLEKKKQDAAADLFQEWMFYQDQKL